MNYLKGKLNFYLSETNGTGAKKKRKEKKVPRPC